MRIHNEESEPFTEDTGNEKFKVFSRVLSTEYIIYLSDSVEAQSLDYSDLLNILDTVKETDVVRLKLSNFGGAVHSGLRICHAMKNCPAIVEVQAEGPCYSMGAIIALCGDLLYMAPGSFLMFHNYSTVESGKGGEVQAAVSEYRNHFLKTFKHMCYPFLTKKEINNIDADKDVYIHSDDANLADRLVRHFKMIKKIK